MDRRAWWVTVHKAAESWTQLVTQHTHTHMYCLHVGFLWLISSTGCVLVLTQLKSLSYLYKPIAPYFGQDTLFFLKPFLSAQLLISS